jgi:hypothetical protein
MDENELREFVDRDNNKDVLYKYVSPKTALIVLSNHTLRWSSPLHFNDPFDMRLDLFELFDSKIHYKKTYNEVIKLIKSDKPIPNYQSTKFLEIFENLRQLYKSGQTSLARLESELEPLLKNQFKMLHATYKNQNDNIINRAKKTGVLCLSETHNNLLMWAHYAQNHSGVVIGIRCRVGELRNEFSMCLPVQYTKKMPYISRYNILDPNFKIQIEENAIDAHTNMVYTKSIDWEYEKEWRITKTLENINNGFDDVPLNPIIIESIYLGCNISPQDKRNITELVQRNKYKSTNLYQAVKSASEYSLLFDLIT